MHCSSSGVVKAGLSNGRSSRQTNTLTINTLEYEVTGRHECIGIPPPNSGIQWVKISVRLNIRDGEL